MLEDTITASNWERDPEAMATLGILRYLASPKGLTAVELLNLLAWFDASEWITMPTPDFLERLTEERSAGRRDEHWRRRDAA